MYIKLTQMCGNRTHLGRHLHRLCQPFCPYMVFQTFVRYDLEKLFCFPEIHQQIKLFTMKSISIDSLFAMFSFVSCFLLFVFFGGGVFVWLLYFKLGFFLFDNRIRYKNFFKFSQNLFTTQYDHAGCR